MKLHAVGHANGIQYRLIGRISRIDLSPDERADTIYLWNESSQINISDFTGYLAVLVLNDNLPQSFKIPSVCNVKGLDYLNDGDIVVLAPNGFVRTLYRKSSNHNFLLLADNCNSYCLMCSQPPKPVNDLERVHEHFQIIDLIAPETKELGLTGGEPTLIKDSFLEIIRHCKEKLTNTSLHVLTNGRMFFYREFAKQLASINHPDLMLGIPLYSDVDSEHDYIVQAQNAFHQTILGLYHLAQFDIGIEIRVVLHKQTYKRLPQLAEFIARNIPFAKQVSLMGLEMTGLSLANPNEIWIDPIEYQSELKAAAEFLYLAGMNVRLYNQQLCILDKSLWRFAVKSISDWKRIYLPACEQCIIRSDCGGVFETSKGKHSKHIRPFTNSDTSLAFNQGKLFQENFID